MAHDPAAPPLRDFRLGDWLVQPSLNRLVRGDTFIHFRPKVMDVLVCLASRAGEVVAKEAIVDAVWAKEFIADSTFSRAIFELRESLGDDPQHPTYLETIPKRGYRLLAPVEMLGSPAAESCPRPEPRQRLAWLALAAVGLALVAAGRLLVGPSGSERTLEAADALVRGVAVLPFENVGPAEDEYLAAGVTDEIRGRLAVTPGLRVVAGGLPVANAGSADGSADTATRLGVDFFLSGTVRWDGGNGSGSRLRITPRLVRSSDGTVLWAESYERSADDILALQSEIARNVIARLELTLAGEGPAPVEELPKVPVEAYQAYLRGYHHTRRPDEDPESLRLAVRLFTRATDFAPDFARAWSERAKVEARLVHLGVADGAAMHEAARRDVERALELAPQDPTVHVSRALVLYWCERAYEDAFRELEEARRLGSRAEDLWQTEAWILRRLGRFDEAAVRLMATLGVSPDNTQVLLELGITNLLVRRYEEAERAFDRTVALAPDEGFGYYYKAWNLRLWRGAIDEARRVLESAPVLDDSRQASEWFEQGMFEGDIEGALVHAAKIDPDAPQLACDHCAPDLHGAVALALLGRRQEARARFSLALGAIDDRLRDSPGDIRFISGRAVALAGLGRPEEGLREAQRAVDLCPIARDALVCVCPKIHLAFVAQTAGDVPRACSVLDELLSIPAPISTYTLHLDPRWGDVARHSCFAALQAKYPSGGTTP